MFWGLIMEPNKRYTQTVERPFHVSMATLDVSTADDEIVQVMVCYENRNYLLCNLKKGLTWQVPLDLNFQEGTKIAFTSNGRGHVHMTGYLVPEDDMGMDDEDIEEEEEDEDEEVPQLVGKQGKRKSTNEDSKATKRIKSLMAELAEDDDSSDDEDVNGHDDTVEGDDSDESGEEEEEEESDEDEDEDDEEEEESSEEEEKKPVATKLSKKQQQQQNKQQKDTKDTSLVNGKDANQTQKKNKQKKEQQKEQPKEQQKDQQQVQKKKVLGGGVQIEELKVGGGPLAKTGKFVSVYYVGKLKNGKKFDSTNTGEGFKFRLGGGEVIKGWDIGVQGMKVGGKRRITVPAAMGYGARGSPPVIPGNSVLVFEVELKKVH